MNSVKILTVSMLIFMPVAGCASPTPEAFSLPVTETSIPSAQLELPPPPIPSAPAVDMFIPLHASLGGISLAPQTINGVTATIDWAYADESRISIGYTITGLDWPDGVQINAAFSNPRLASSAISNINFGAYGGGTSLVESGVMHGKLDQLLNLNAIDAKLTPQVDLQFEIPVDGTDATLITVIPTPGQPFESIDLPQIGTFHFDFMLPVHEGIELLNLDQSVEANGVVMALRSLALNRSRADALLCFQIPSAADWEIRTGKIEIINRLASDVVDNSSLFLGDYDKTTLPSITDPERCTGIAFDLLYDGSPAAVTLTIPKLQTRYPLDSISAELVRSANLKLAKEGIVLELDDDPHSPFIIVQKPAGMFDTEAYPLAWEALADEYPGPWTFTVEVAR